MQRGWIGSSAGARFHALESGLARPDFGCAVMPASPPFLLPILCGLAVTLSMAVSPRFAGAAEAVAPNPLAILQRNCLRCHTEDKRKGGLLMATREGFLAGGDSGPAFLPGQSGGSLLIETLFPDSDTHMPPKGQLKTAEIEALANWIDAGAPWDEALWKQLRLSPLDGPVTLNPLPSGYEPVFAVALAPDGKTLAAGRGNRIEWLGITETVNGKVTTLAFAPAGTTEPGPDPVQALAWSPDGRTLAAGSFRRVTLWDTGTKQKRAELTDGLLGRISALAFAPDSKSLLAADSVDAASGRLLAIDAGSAKVARTIEAHRDTIFGIAISPDGKIAATASADKSVKTWSLADGKPLRNMEGHTSYVLGAAFSPTGDRIATAGDDEAIKVWMTDTGKQVANFGGVRTGPVTAVAWTSDSEKEKLKAAERDAEKAKAINADRIASVNQSGTPKVYADLQEHQGEQTSTGARERSYDPAIDELTAIAVDPVTFRVFSGTIKGSIIGWDDKGKIALRSDVATAIAQTKP